MNIISIVTSGYMMHVMEFGKEIILTPCRHCSHIHDSPCAGNNPSRSQVPKHGINNKFLPACTCSPICPLKCSHVPIRIPMFPFTFPSMFPMFQKGSHTSSHVPKQAPINVPKTPLHVPSQVPMFPFGLSVPLLQFWDSQKSQNV